MAIHALLFGERMGLGGLAAAGVFGYASLAPWADTLLSEVVFVPILCIWTLMLLTLARTNEDTERDHSVRPSEAIAVGVLGGVATLTRSTLLLGWLVALPLLALALRSRRRSIISLVVATMLAVTSLATVRNWVVARELVPIASSGPVNLYLGNTPAAPLTAPPERQAYYDRLGFDPNSTQVVLEYVAQQPRAFLAGLVKKATYTLGWFESMRPGGGRSDFYVTMWLAAVAGLCLIGRAPPSAFSWATAIPASLALAHFAAVVIIFPHVYGDRLILPFYALLVPYVGVTLVAACRLLAGPVLHAIRSALSRT